MFNLTRSLRLASVSRTYIRPTAAFKTQPAVFSAKRFYSDHTETFEEFTTRQVKLFEEVDDVFELQRCLTNCFSYDLVPAPSVIEAALKASRRVNDYSTAVRIFEGIKDKVDNEGQYKQYLDELKHIREELSINTKEELGL